MMKKLVYISLGIVLVIVTACQKDAEHAVVYKITRSVSGFDVNYRDANGILQMEQVQTQSAEDVWTYKFEGTEGDIVFVSGTYEDPESAILVQILIDGKVMKEGSSSGDTTRYVTVSGTIPYR
jgi:hypothetical protein